MTEIERRAVLDASVACRPARTPSIPPDLLEPIPFQIAFDVALDQLIMEKLGGLPSFIPSWTFGDCPHGIQFKEDDSALYSKLSECRQRQWKEQRTAGLLVHRATDLILQTHYAKSGDIQFKLIPAPHEL